MMHICEKLCSFYAFRKDGGGLLTSKWQSGEGSDSSQVLLPNQKSHGVSRGFSLKIGGRFLTGEVADPYHDYILTRLLFNFNTQVYWISRARLAIMRRPMW